MAPSRQADVIGSYISAHARREKADEYTEVRKMAEGDINADGIKDTVVLYSLEGPRGGNGYVQYIAVFTGSRRGEPRFLARTEAGGKTRRSVELQRVAQGKIFLSTKSYRPSDPSCCPTRNGRTTYRVAGKKLVEG